MAEVKKITLCPPLKDPDNPEEVLPFTAALLAFAACGVPKPMGGPSSVALSHRDEKSIGSEQSHEKKRTCQPSRLRKPSRLHID